MLFMLLGFAAVLTVRFAYPTSTPYISADEGTWPLTVRHFVTDGSLEPNFFTTPGYHVLLAVPFTVFGPTLLVARVVSAVLGLVNLILVYRLCMRLFDDRRIAWWAVLLLGVSYPALLIDRKGFIEPFMLTWLLILILAYLSSGKTALVAIVISTAGLLLTKAQGAFMVPALALVSVLEWRRSPAGGWGHLGALALGTVLAGLTFGGLYLANQESFMMGWGQKLMVDHDPTVGASPRSVDTPPTHVQPLIRFGRFAVNPAAWDKKLRDLAGVEPFLFVGGMAAAVKALRLRRHAVLAVWFPAAIFAYLAIGPLDNHVAPALPALAIGAAWFYLDGQPAGWRGWVVGCAFLFGLIRSAGGLITGRDPSGTAVRWLQRRIAEPEVTMAAPRLAMQMRGAIVSMFELSPPYRPTCDDLRRLRVNWVLMDRRVWGGYLRRKGSDVGPVVESLRGCTSVEFRDDAATILKVQTVSSQGPGPPHEDGRRTREASSLAVQSAPSS